MVSCARLKPSTRTITFKLRRRDRAGRQGEVNTTIRTINKNLDERIAGLRVFSIVTPRGTVFHTYSCYFFARSRDMLERRPPLPRHKKL